MNRCSAGSVVLADASDVAELPAPPTRPPGASLLRLPSAAGGTSVPRLYGRMPARSYAMQAFARTALPGTVMDRIAKGFSDDEIARDRRLDAAAEG